MNSFEAESVAGLSSLEVRKPPGATGTPAGATNVLCTNTGCKVTDNKADESAAGPK